MKLGGPPKPETNHLTGQMRYYPHCGMPLTKTYIETLLKRYAKKAGIEGVRCSPHTFRHTFAISYLRNGGDVFSLQHILGHSSLDVVRIYVNLAQVDIKAAHRRYSPADNMNLGTR